MLKLLRKAVAFEKQRGCFDYFLRSYHHRHTVYKRRNTIQIYGSHTLTMLYHFHEHQRERPVARQVNLCYSVRNPQILPHACADHKIRIPARILLSTRSSNLPIYSFSPRRFRLTTRRERYGGENTEEKLIIFGFRSQEIGTSKQLEHEKGRSMLCC